MKISIVIPVYNVDQYLRRCLDSCLRQDLSSEDYELIVVNDGSPDNSLNIIQEYVSKFSNVILVDKLNGGLSSARNAGLKNAKGDYIWFVDSDDWIKENCLASIVRVAERENLEVLTYEAVVSDGETVKQLPEKRSLRENVVYSGLDLYKSGYVFPYSGAPFYIFKRDFLEKNQLYFYEGILFEDLLFSSRMMARAQRCGFVNDSFYFYFVREGSITQSKTTLKKGLDAIKIADLLHDEQVECKELQNNLIYNSNIAASVLGIQMHWCRLSGYDRNAVRQCFLEKKYWFDCIKRSGKFKFFIPFLLLTFNFPIKIK